MNARPNDTPGSGLPDITLEEQQRIVSNLVHHSFASQFRDAQIKKRFAVAQTRPKDIQARMHTPDLGPQPGELKQSLLVMRGLQDEFCPQSSARHFLVHGCNVRTMTANHLGHWAQVERAEEFNYHSIGFLRG